MQIYNLPFFSTTTPNVLLFWPEDEKKMLSLKEKEMIRSTVGLMPKGRGRKICIENTIRYFAEKVNSEDVI